MFHCNRHEYYINYCYYMTVQDTGRVSIGVSKQRFSIKKRTVSMTVCTGGRRVMPAVSALLQLIRGTLPISVQW